MEKRISSKKLIIPVPELIRVGKHSRNIRIHQPVYLLIQSLILFFYIAGYSHASVIGGKIFNTNTGKPVRGAEVLCLSNGLRTYSTSDGYYRLPFPDKAGRLQIRAIGFGDAYIEFAESDSVYDIKLLPDVKAPLKYDGSAKYHPDSVITGIIRKKNNQFKLMKTLQGLVYTKFSINLDGTVWGIVNASGSNYKITRPRSILPEDYKKNYLIESFSNIYYRSSDDRTFLDIIYKRQAADFQPDKYLSEIDGLLNFYNDKVKILNLEIPSPLADNALEYYKYIITKAYSSSGRDYIEIEFAPLSKMHPGFKGNFIVTEDDYIVREIDIQLSKSTKITLFDDFRIFMKLSEVEPGISVPVYTTFRAGADVRFLTDYFKIRTDIKLDNIMVHAISNSKIPEEIFAEDQFIRDTVSIDTLSDDFWERNSLAGLDEQEIAILSQAKKIKYTNNQKDEIGYHVYPYFDFNRVVSVSSGIRQKFNIGDLMLVNSNLYWSFGQKRFFADIEFRKGLYNSDNFFLEMSSRIFSTDDIMTTERSYSRFLNSVVALLRHKDYYDYFRKDGWNIGFNAGYKRVNVFSRFEKSNHFTLKKKTNNSILSSETWRDNPDINQGEYKTITTGLRLIQNDIFFIPGKFHSDFSLEFTYGENDHSSRFRIIEGKLYLLIPTFNYGFAPLNLEILIHEGNASPETPVQYQFRMRTDLSIISKFGHFTSAPDGTYGGTDFRTVHIRYNTADYLWRICGLPLYKGRGIDFILALSAGSFSYDKGIFYVPDFSDYYIETGFSLARIPMFISNVFYMSVDTRWGIGNLASGKFGISVSASMNY